MDREAFRERFKAYKEGKPVSEIYDAGLPKYKGGKWSYTPSDKVRKHIAKWEGTDFAGLNELFGGDAIGAKAKEFTNTMRQIGANLTQDELDGLFSTFYNVAPRTYEREFLPAVTNYANNKTWETQAAMDTALRNRYMLSKKIYLKGIKRRAAADVDLMGLSLQLPIQEEVPVSTAVRPVIKEEKTVPAYDTTISPYISGKPMLKLRPRVQLPNLIELMEDSEWEPGFPGLKNGKLPCFEMGTPEGVDMGEKRNTPISIEQVRNTPHEQGMSGTDPIGKFVVESVGMTKGAKILGDILSAARLRRMADTYRNLRKYDQDILNYTGKSLRKLNMQFADKIARDGFLYSRPENPLYWILDPIMAGYTKLQSHPVIGPLIPFKNGKLPEYKNGKIHIKPANRGKFTALKKRTGHSASWFKENGTPAQKKMAVFALNVKKWKH